MIISSLAKDALSGLQQQNSNRKFVLPTSFLTYWETCWLDKMQVVCRQPLRLFQWKDLRLIWCDMCVCCCITCGTVLFWSVFFDFTCTPQKKKNPKLPWSPWNQLRTFMTNQSIDIKINFCSITGNTFNTDSVSVWRRKDTVSLYQICLLTSGKRRRSFPLSCRWFRRLPPHYGSGLQYGGTYMW